jgi:hypothetical protein
MNCAEIRLHLSALLDRALPEELAQPVAAHILICPACRSELDRLRELGRLVKSSLPARPSPSLDERVLGAFRQYHDGGVNQPRPWSKLIRGSSRIPNPFLALTAALAVLALPLSFDIGRRVGSQVVFVESPQPVALTANPPIVEVPVLKVPTERERIVYPRSARSRNVLNATPARSADGASERNARDSIPVARSSTLKSIEDFEPIRGATARVIAGSKQR